MNANFKKDILEVANGEPILAIIIQEPHEYGFGENKPFYKNVENKLMSWEEAIPYLDYDYDDGYGGEDCHAIYAWTENKVIFVQCYDGATRVSFVPRNITDKHKPVMFGGG